MARGKFISEFERDVIRIGHARGVKNGQIAKYLGRTRECVWQQVRKMQADGTINNLPFSFAAEEIARAMKEGRK